ncbi:hypothetical protein GCM10022252_20130 [Streptosporangium oxazolinicum]|uniref:Uncharacterized protein n=1 Tax=Streptosporangium oxazolinicum TaxID=909287 RepID=A0ABP8ANZ3_9ACTN
MLPEYIEQAAEDIKLAFRELKTCGFTDDEALQLTSVVLLHAERRGGK